MSKSNAMSFAPSAIIRGIAAQTKAVLGAGIARSYSYGFKVVELKRNEFMTYEDAADGQKYCSILLTGTDGRTRMCNVVKGKNNTDKGICSKEAKGIWKALAEAAASGEEITVYADNGFSTNTWFCGVVTAE